MRASFPAAVGGVAIAIAASGSEDWLRYQRGEILDGQFWRLLSGHLVHLGPTHLALNLFALVFVWLLFRTVLASPEWWAGAAACALGTGFGLLLNPHIDWYAGLSGILHGLLVLGALSLPTERRRETVVLVSMVAVKVGWELAAGPLPGSTALAGGPVVVAAHGWGLVSGLALGAFRRRRHREA